MVQGTIDEVSSRTPVTFDVPEGDQEKLRFLAHAALARADLAAFNTFIDPSYRIYPGLKLLIEHLEAVERGDIKRLIVTMPPRHGKSETTSGKFPGWCIGKDPSRNIILTSYSATLAETFSTQNRDTITTNPRWRYVFPRVSIDPNKKGREKWAVSGKRESVLAAGVGGAITGFGAWLLIIDDPVKHAEEAGSTAYQEKLFEWYKTTSRTRLTPDGRIILIMTRWHENDLAGKILASEEGDQYTVLHLPALSYGTEAEYRERYPIEEDYEKAVGALPKTAFPDRLSRSKDTPLWEDQFGLQFLLDAKLVMEHGFEGLYQGNPSSPAGEKFKRDWFKPIAARSLAALPVVPVASARSWDLAWSSKTSADFTVGLKATLYKTDAKKETELAERLGLGDVRLPPVFVVLEELVRYQKEWDEGERELEKQLIADGRKVDVLMEAVASQNIAVKAIKKKPLFWRHRIIAVTPGHDKEVRAKYAMQLASKGLVFILYSEVSLRPAWEEAFLREMAAFPNGAKDDQVDAFTQLVNHWADRIDKLLVHIARATWSTPFMPVAENEHRTPGQKRPAPFRETASGSPKRDKLSWV